MLEVMPKPTLLVSESARFSPKAQAKLASAFELLLEDLDREALLRNVPEAEVLWVRLRHAIDAEVLSAAPRLRAIVSATTGLNHVDLEACEARKIAVLSLRGHTEFLEEVRATAEATMLLILSLLRRLPEALACSADRNDLIGADLDGKTVGIVGFGRIGRMVGRLCEAFRAEVLAHDVRSLPGVELVSFARLLEQSDVVSLHASFSPQNAGMFGRAQFERMKPGAWFVNTSRGELVDETALLGALESGRLAGAALDVVANETSLDRQNHRLFEYARRHPNLILTPHIGGATIESIHKTEDFMAEKLLEWCAAC